MLTPVKKILYASDLGQGARSAFRMAVSIARQYDAEIIFAHAIEPMGRTAENLLRGYVSADEIHEMQDEGMKHLHDKMAERLHAFYKEELPEGVEFPHGDPRIAVREGTPSDVILQIAEEEDIDLIVMGSRTHTRLGQALLGSNANKVIHKSKRPTLIVPLGPKPVE